MATTPVAGATEAATSANMLSDEFMARAGETGRNGSRKRGYCTGGRGLSSCSAVQLEKQSRERSNEAVRDAAYPSKNRSARLFHVPNEALGRLVQPGVF